MGKIFISYAREDSDAAKILCRELRRVGLDPWLDSEELLPGQHWRSEIERAIKKSSHFLALISTNSVDKQGYVQRELRQGLSLLAEYPPGKVFIIPVRLEEVRSSHERLNDLQWVDLFSSYEEAIAKIKCAVVGRQLQEITLRTKSSSTMGDTYTDEALEEVKPKNKAALRSYFLLAGLKYGDDESDVRLLYGDPESERQTERLDFMNYWNRRFQVACGVQDGRIRHIAVSSKKVIKKIKKIAGRGGLEYYGSSKEELIRFFGKPSEETEYSIQYDFRDGSNWGCVEFGLGEEEICDELTVYWTY